MRTFIKALGLFIGIACLVWVAVLWHWQSTHRDMSAEDIVMYLGVLPLTVFVLVLAARWAWRGVAAKSAAASAAAAASTASAPTAATVAPSAAEAERRWAWPLWQAHAVSAAGESPDAMLQALASGQPRPAVCQDLRDLRGLPVMLAQVPGLDSSDISEALHTLARDGAGEWPAGHLRALALLDRALQEALDACPSRSAAPPSAEATRHRVLCAWPPHWQEAQRSLAQRWLEQRLQDAAAANPVPARWQVQSLEVSTGPQLWLSLEQWLLRLRREGQDAPLWLLSCHSDIDQAVVDGLDSQGRLFSAHQPRGRLPGEAATVLRLGTGLAPLTDELMPIAWLGRAAVGQLDKPIDEPGRREHGLCAELLRQALQVAAVDAAAVAGQASDADLHSARNAEACATMLAQLPDLDAVADHRSLGVLCGHLGLCATPLAIALAAQACATGAQPWAALSVSDPQARLALLALPTAPDSAVPSVPTDQPQSTA